MHGGLLRTLDARLVLQRGIRPVPLAPAVLPRQPPDAIAVASSAAMSARTPSAATSMATCPGLQGLKHATLRL